MIDLGHKSWLGSYLGQAMRLRAHKGPQVLCLAVADHFEPFGTGAGHSQAMDRLAAWETGLPSLAAGLQDSQGRSYRHTFFPPLEDYDPQVLDRLAALCQKGVADVEVHFHHSGESSAQLEDKLASYAQLLRSRHGLLRDDTATGRPSYGFVHGNWALDNSHPDGIHCGVNDELQVLRKSGCYADFTLPSAPSPTQTRTINSIYYATDDPEMPKSHDVGEPVRVGGSPTGDLLIVQGVLALSWRRRRRALFPRVENSELADHNPPDVQRVPLWLRNAPRVKGAEGYCFVKLHCHGAPERHHQALLGPAARRLWEHLARRAQDDSQFELRFCSCWEMVEIIHQLERHGDQRSE